MNLGRTHNLTAGAIAGMIYNEASLPKGAIGRINLFPKHTLIDVKRELAEQTIEGCRSAELFGKPIRLEIDRGRPEERGDDDRGPKPYGDRKKSYGKGGKKHYGKSKKPYGKGGGEKRY